MSEMVLLQNGKINIRELSLKTFALVLIHDTYCLKPVISNIHRKYNNMVDRYHDLLFSIVDIYRTFLTIIANHFTEHTMQTTYFL